MPTPDGFEYAVANYIALALTACNGLDVTSLYPVISRGFLSATTSSYTPFKKAAKLDFSGVVVLQSRSPIHKGSGMDEVAVEEHFRQQKKALVIVNAPKAEFADIIVAIPMVGLILVQCKYYRDWSKLTAHAAYHELFKMGCLSDTAKIGHFAATVRKEKLKSIDKQMPKKIRQMFQRRSLARRKNLPREAMFESLMVKYQKGKGYPRCIHVFAAAEFGFRSTVRSLEQTFGVHSTALCLATTTDPLPGLDGAFQLHVTSVNCFPQPIPETYTPRADTAVIAEYGSKGAVV